MATKRPLDGKQNPPAKRTKLNESTPEDSKEEKKEEEESSFLGVHTLVPILLPSAFGSIVCHNNNKLPPLRKTLPKFNYNHTQPK